VQRGDRRSDVQSIGHDTGSVYATISSFGV